MPVRFVFVHLTCRGGLPHNCSARVRVFRTRGLIRHSLPDTTLKSRKIHFKKAADSQRQWKKAHARNKWASGVGWRPRRPAGEVVLASQGLVKV